METERSTVLMGGTTPHKINGHEYVDLGLSVKWATCNVGATSPTQFGDYFAWGEVEAKSEYRNDNSLLYKKDVDVIAGHPQLDVATVQWGDPWRLPTAHELYELAEYCTRKWMILDGVSGYYLVGPSGNAIFLPAAGFCKNSSLKRPNKDGFYWSGTPFEKGVLGSVALCFGKNTMGEMLLSAYSPSPYTHPFDAERARPYGRSFFLFETLRYAGESVRPVME